MTETYRAYLTYRRAGVMRDVRAAQVGRAGFHLITHRAFALAGRVQGSGDQVEAFQGGFVGGEVAAGIGMSPWESPWSTRPDHWRAGRSFATRRASPTPSGLRPGSVRRGRRAHGPPPPWRWPRPGCGRRSKPAAWSRPRSRIEDYAERTEQTITAWKAMNGQQGGDPAKLADALVHLADQEEPPLRFPAGADAVAAFERRANILLAQGNAYRDLSSNLALDSD